MLVSCTLGFFGVGFRSNPGPEWYGSIQLFLSKIRTQLIFQLIRHPLLLKLLNNINVDLVLCSRFSIDLLDH